ncbi:hypothetical protein [Ammoniphilus oxalaticus]|uniref:hypothetical protein n=1 Tax=Ammoniphilus oxalaticus TaxID=66863 RepID=UPI00147662D1|nr:hypothetical protein [Ammoniphilus oxalaticus]
MFWIVVISIVVIGLIGCLVINARSADYDLFTPLIAVTFGLLFIGVAIGLVLGKFVF